LSHVKKIAHRAVTERILPLMKDESALSSNSFIFSYIQKKESALSSIFLSLLHVGGMEKSVGMILFERYEKMTRGSMKQQKEKTVKER